jgi:alanine racemase
MNYKVMLDTINQIHISSRNLLHNFDYFQSLSEFVFPVVKSNAYCHGIKEVAKILEAREFPYLVFDKYYEYENSKEFIKQNVLIMGHLDFDDLTQIDFEKVTLVAQDQEVIEKLSLLSQKVKVHLEINTGMNRWGIKPEELHEYLELIKTSSNLILEGIMSHLADSDSYPDDYTNNQAIVFDKCVETIFEVGFRPKYIHLAQTAGAYKNISKYCNSIRVGIGLYGINNLLESDIAYTKSNNFYPVLSLSSKIVKIIIISKGEKVGYNCIFEAKEDCNIAVIPIGYFEGVNRNLGNKGYVKICGKFYQFAGKICMNIAMINLEKDIYPIGTSVEVISKCREDLNSIDNISKISNTFQYGLLTSLNVNLTKKII